MNAELDRLRAFVEAYIENATQRHEMMTSHDSWPGNARAQGEMTALESVRYMIAAVGQAAEKIEPVVDGPPNPLPPVGSDAWAMAMLLQDKRVRRRGWDKGEQLLLVHGSQLNDSFHANGIDDWELSDV